MSEDLAAQLRQAFDEGFQLLPPSTRSAQEDLLVIGLGEQASYGLRLSQVSALVREKMVTPLPGGPADLLGVAGFRGQLVAVYDLAGLLGQSRGQPSWLALVAGPDGSRLGLAFDKLESQLRVDPDDLVPQQTGRHIEALVQRPQGALSVLSVASLLETITQSREGESP